MHSGLFALPDKIKELRKKSGYTQAELARKLGLTRSSINSWEMGLSIPSTPYIIELSNLFGVSTDYLLGMENENMVIHINGLSEEEVAILISLLEYFRNNNK